MNKLLVKIFIFVALVHAVQAEEVARDEVTKVSTATFESLAFYPTKNAPAKVESLNQSKIPAEISAVVSRIFAQSGQFYSKGELLAELDCRKTDFALLTQQAIQKQLQSQQAFLEREVERGKKLFKRHNLGEAELDRRNSDLLSIQAQLDAQVASVGLALFNQAACKITAPFSGVVLNRIANEGEMLDRGAPLLEMVQTNRLEVSAKIALSDTESFENASHYYFKINNQSYPLKLGPLAKVVANNSLSREARLEFIEDSAIPGTTGRLFWTAPVIHLPAHLLQKRQGKYGVFVVESNIAKFKVIVNAQEGRPFAVAIDSWKSSIIVVDGRHGLKDQQNIEGVSLKNNKIITSSEVQQ